jgi:hypothetical protein
MIYASISQCIHHGGQRAYAWISQNVPPRSAQMRRDRPGIGTVFIVASGVWLEDGWFLDSASGAAAGVAGEVIAIQFWVFQQWLSMVRSSTQLMIIA